MQFLPVCFDSPPNDGFEENYPGESRREGSTIKRRETRINRIRSICRVVRKLSGKVIHVADKGIIISGTRANVFNARLLIASLSRGVSLPISLPRH